MFEKEKKMIRFRKLYKAEFRVVFKVFYSGFLKDIFKDFRVLRVLFRVPV